MYVAIPDIPIGARTTRSPPSESSQIVFSKAYIVVCHTYEISYRYSTVSIVEHCLFLSYGVFSGGWKMGKGGKNRCH